jgi:predicted CXXCH cytochrome family protein
MKILKLSLILVVPFLLATGINGFAQTFHSGGVANCEGCHSMHAPKAGGSYLLKGTDVSSTCLNCHQDAADTGPTRYHISTVDSKLTTGNPLQRTPGGDFSWTKKQYSYASGTATIISTGGGHKINAFDFNYVPGTGSSPGGTFPSANLGCNSCHDPHGQYRRDNSGAISKTGKPIKASGSYNGTENEPTANEAVGVYRLLRGAGSTQNGVTFPGNPAAKAPSTFNQTEATNQVRVAYGTANTGGAGHVGWGEWCGTCHGDMHYDGGAKYVHPTDDALSGTVIANYDSYVKTGDMTGAKATSFTSLVPFATNATGAAGYAALATLANNAAPTSAGPSTNDQVTCFSCHRSHASGFDFALRWDYGYEFMTKGGDYIGSDNPEVTGSGAGVQHRGRTMADWEDAYYDRPSSKFATYQRVLCNKCHAKD